MYYSKLLIIFELYIIQLLLLITEIFVFIITLLLCIALYGAVIFLDEKNDFLYLSGFLVIRTC